MNYPFDIAKKVYVPGEDDEVPFQAVQYPTEVDQTYRYMTWQHFKPDDISKYPESARINKKK